MVGIAEVNAWERAHFIEVLGRVFEASPWVAHRVWTDRPFRSREHLHEAMCEVVRSSSEADKLALLGAHPDLAGRAAETGRLSPESAREQAGAGIDRVNPGEAEVFRWLNQAYRAKFGFPFVICARESSKEAMLEGFAVRLPNSRERELETAIEEVFRIALHRLADIIGPTAGPAGASRA